MALSCKTVVEVKGIEVRVEKLGAGRKLVWPRGAQRARVRCSLSSSRSRGLPTRLWFTGKKAGHQRGPRGLGEEIEKTLSSKHIWEVFS